MIVRSDLSKYDPQTNLLSMTFDFVFDTKKKTLDRFSETHVVKTYSVSHTKELLERSGLRALAFYDGSLNKKDELTQASFSTFRVLVVTKR